MAYFYGRMKGRTTDITRTGTSSSGIEAHLQGWDIGIKVRLYYDRNLRKDVVEVFETDGPDGNVKVKYVSETVLVAEGDISSDDSEVPEWRRHYGQPRR